MNALYSNPTTRRSPQHRIHLKEYLSDLRTEFHQARFLSSDPLEFVHRYRDPRDQEAVALLSALLAYGKVAQIRKSVTDALNRMEKVSSSPSEFVEKLEGAAPLRQAHQTFHGFVHRFNRGSDIVHLFRLLNLSWRKHGSLGNHFGKHLNSDAADIGPALSLLIDEWKKWVTAASDVEDSFSYLLTSPADGSCCKRWCMFLRWMGRKDRLDPGLWSNHVLPRQLVMPLDTHTGRISQYLGLTSRKTIDWKTALEVTESLKKLDPQDPTQYDFALSRLGILDLCQRKYREEICRQCQLLPVCQFARAQKSSNGASRSMRSSA